MPTRNYHKEDLEYHYKSLFWSEFERMKVYFYVTKFLNEPVFIWASKSDYPDFAPSYDILEDHDLIMEGKMMCAQLKDYRAEVSLESENITIRATSPIPSAWRAAIKPSNVEKLNLIFKIKPRDNSACRFSITDLT